MFCALLSSELRFAALQSSELRFSALASCRLRFSALVRCELLSCELRKSEPVCCELLACAMLFYAVFLADGFSAWIMPSFYAVECAAIHTSFPTIRVGRIVACADSVATTRSQLPLVHHHRDKAGAELRW